MTNPARKKAMEKAWKRHWARTNELRPGLRNRIDFGAGFRAGEKFADKQQAENLRVIRGLRCRRCGEFVVEQEVIRTGKRK